MVLLSTTYHHKPPGKDRITWPRPSLASNSAAPAASRCWSKGRLRAGALWWGLGRQRPGSVAGDGAFFNLGVWWFFMVFDGFWCFFLWFLMVFDVVDGFWLFLMVFFIVLFIVLFIVFFLFLMVFYGFWCFFLMVFDGFWCFWWYFNGFWWFLMFFYCFVYCFFIVFDCFWWFWWFLMVFDGFWPILMDFDGFWWICLLIYWFLTLLVGWTSWEKHGKNGVVDHHFPYSQGGFWFTIGAENHQEILGISGDWINNI